MGVRRSARLGSGEHARHIGLAAGIGMSSGECQQLDAPRRRELPELIEFAILREPHHVGNDGNGLF